VELSPSILPPWMDRRGTDPGSAASFFHAYGGGYDPSAIVDHLGKPWTFQNRSLYQALPQWLLTHLE